MLIWKDYTTFVVAYKIYYSMIKTLLASALLVSNIGLGWFNDQFKTYDKMQKELHELAEPGFVEYKSSELIIKHLEENGFKVERGVSVNRASTDEIKTLIDFIYLIFCFLGWYLLSLFIFPMIYTLPYAITAYCVHCRFAVADYNKHTKRVHEENLPTYSVGI